MNRFYTVVLVLLVLAMFALTPLIGSGLREMGGRLHGTDTPYVCSAKQPCNTATVQP